MFWLRAKAMGVGQQPTGSGMQPPDCGAFAGAEAPDGGGGGDGGGGSVLTTGADFSCSLGRGSASFSV
jgi:hypothetical protein